MEYVQRDNPKEVFKIKAEYFNLDNDKKKKVLEDICIWIGVEKSNLK